MDSFEVLEKKVVQLIELTQKLQKENAQLAQDKASLSEKLSALESNLSKNNEVVEQEREKAKLFVADIISNIDQLVESNG